MKRFFSVLPLVCAAMLLSACPDTKLPNPAPRVPAPKAIDSAGKQISKLPETSTACTA